MTSHEFAELEEPELDLEWPDGSYERYRAYFGKTVRCTVPVEFYSADWHDGMRSRTYIGTVCSHFESVNQVCLQPPPPGQGWEGHGKCFVLTRDMSLEILPGKLSEYQ